MLEGVHIWHSKWLLSVHYNKCLISDHRCDLGIEDLSQIYLESLCLMARNTNSSFLCFDLGFPYLAQWLPVVCGLQQKFKITDMTLESKVKVKYI